MKYISRFFNTLAMFAITFVYAFTFRNTSSSPAACLLTAIVGREEGIYTLAHARPRRLVKLSPSEHVARDIRAGRKRLFADTFQHRYGASKQSAKNTAETMSSLTSRTLKHRQRASCLPNIIVCKQRLLSIAAIPLPHIRY